VRAKAPALLDPGVALPTLLRLSHDEAPMVRAAALDPIEAVVAEDTRALRALLTNGDLTPAERVAAYTFLLRDPTPDSQRLWSEARADPAEPPEVRAHLDALGVLFGEPPSLPAPAPAPAQPADASPPPQSTPTPAAPVERRALGPRGVEVAPLVISGANGVPAFALADAVAAGADTLFWEPRYLELTRFLRRRPELQVVCGTYHADRAGIRRDVETALRRLRRETLDVFLVFWVRSPARLSDEVFETLRELQAEGKLRTFGFSTHHRDLAVEALERRAWEVVMTRHNAAHVGAEQRLFPAARARGTGLLTFSAVCYGRMLRHPPGVDSSGGLPDAADCYRYSLSQPGVSGVLCAPRRPGELAHDLEVLARPGLDAAAQAALRAHGQRVYAYSRRFNRLLRQARDPLPLSEALADLFEDDVPLAASERERGDAP
jgi:aryl-alcohol dehydrogenase-like predicted oxidoreductase